jgi:hypothetical protein
MSLGVRLGALNITPDACRQITNGQGKTYHLPTAEYHCEGSDLTIKKVLEDAQRAAGSTNCKHFVGIRQDWRSRDIHDYLARTELSIGDVLDNEL